MTDLTDFHEAWHWLCAHPVFASKGRKGGQAAFPFAGSPTDRDIFGDPLPTTVDLRFNRFTEALDIMVAKVDPVTRRIEDDRSRNTHTEIWLECGPYGDPEDSDHRGNIEFYGDDWLDYGIPTHDYDLDCGGDTFEEAIIKLAGLVMGKYGDYKEDEAIR